MNGAPLLQICLLIDFNIQMLNTTSTTTLYSAQKYLFAFNLILEIEKRIAFACFISILFSSYHVQ